MEWKMKWIESLKEREITTERNRGVKRKRKMVRRRRNRKE